MYIRCRRRLSLEAYTVYASVDPVYVWQVRRILLETSQDSATLLRNNVLASGCALADGCVTLSASTWTIKLRANLSGHWPDRHGHLVHGDDVETRLKERKRSCQKPAVCLTRAIRIRIQVLYTL
jgi:hypothetical protein